MFQTTRRRLAIWYTTVTAILLLIFVTGFYIYFRNTLIERIDDTLLHVVEVVERSLVIESFPTKNSKKFRVNLEASFRDNANTVEDDHIDLEWFSSTGELIWSTFSAPLNIPIHSNRTGETVRITPHLEKVETLQQPIDNNLLLRQITDRVEIDRQVLGYLRVSHPWFEVTKPIRQLMLDLSIITCLVIISVGAIGWLLSGLAIQPVRESYQHLKKFTADASHELRNPIAMIQTNVQVALADRELASSEHQQQLQVIERLTRRLGKLVDDLLFLARQDSGIVQSQFSSVPLDALLIEVVEEQQAIATAQEINLELKISLPDLIEKAVEEGVRSQSSGVRRENCMGYLTPNNFEHRVDGGVLNPQKKDKNQDTSRTIKNLISEEDINLIGDWDQLARLFTNLISNAIQHTPSGGQIVVELQHLPKVKKATLRTQKRELDNSSESSGVIFRGCQNLKYKYDSLQVTVKDNGIGIPIDTLSRLFDRFYRVDPARSHHGTVGSGLGLAIALAIIENHYGQISIESHPQVGTMATVTLPINQSHIKSS
ncbi:MAG: HAMP domain-containing histidine kinase [Okeania sp. SIO2C9]|uniref:sensor histidine kinase n=1 Tax=Okeania sp. SIO2C9 TaxID=2607791 RepID=UPI0013C02BC2|nr:HAMP domain-containing sensor histidine kinase [Okeania sp. SIO2C9]NEQ72718.1 HAMP domain-containing histidine kinase [Okeania sp. SIO2C9]